MVVDGKNSCVPACNFLDVIILSRGCFCRTCFALVFALILYSFCTRFALVFFSGSNVVLVGDEDDLLVQCAEGLLACLSSVGPWPYAYLPVLPFQHVSSMATAMLGYKYLIGYNIKHEYEQKLKHRQLAADGELSDGGGDGGGINPDEEGDEDEDIPPNSKCFSCDWCICGLFVRFLMLVRGVLFLFFFCWDLLQLSFLNCHLVSWLSIFVMGPCKLKPTRGTLATATPTRFYHAPEIWKLHCEHPCGPNCFHWMV